jgi:hypothetical protein
VHTVDVVLVKEKVSSMVPAAPPEPESTTWRPDGWQVAVAAVVELVDGRVEVVADALEVEVEVDLDGPEVVDEPDFDGLLEQALRATAPRTTSDSAVTLLVIGTMPPLPSWKSCHPSRPWA